MGCSLLRRICIRASSSRAGVIPPASEGTPARPQGPLAVDETCQHAFWRGRRLDLSPTEFALLACLHQRAGETVTYEVLLREVWGTPPDQGGSLWQVRSAGTRLMKKLAAAGAHTCRIASVRGSGYRLELYPADQNRCPSRRPVALRVGLILIAAALLAALAAGWLLAKQGRGDPTTLVWYRQQRVPAGGLWALHRGQHCAEGPDGALYCFDTAEERAAATDLLLRDAAPEREDQPRESGAAPVPQPQSE